MFVEQLLGLPGLANYGTQAYDIFQRIYKNFIGSKVTTSFKRVDLACW